MWRWTGFRPVRCVPPSSYPPAVARVVWGGRLAKQTHVQPEIPMDDPATTPREIAALITLLDDPDATVQESIRTRLRTIGRAALPYLREAEADAPQPLRSLLREVIHDLHFTHIQQAWQAIMEVPFVNLERGAFVLARYRFPDLNVQAYQRQLDDFAEAVQPRIEAAEGVERAFVLAQYFTEELGFTGNRAHYYDPNNSFLSWVIDHRQGIPISLSVVFLLIARRLGLPIFGVNMPAHFLVKYDDGTDELYLDLFQGGQPVGKSECVQFLMKAGIKPRAQYFTAAANQKILLRMVRNLIGTAHQTDQTQALQDFKQLLAPWDVHVG